MLDIYVHIVVRPPQLKDQVVLVMIQDYAPSEIVIIRGLNNIMCGQFGEEMM